MSAIHQRRVRYDSDGKILVGGRLVEQRAAQARTAQRSQYIPAARDQTHMQMLLHDMGALVGYGGPFVSGFWLNNGSAGVNHHGTFATSGTAATLDVETSLGPAFVGAQLNSGAYIEVPNHLTSGLSDPVKTFTVIIGFRPGDFHGNYLLYQRGGTGQGAVEFILLDSTDQALLQIRTANGDQICAPSLGAISDIWKDHILSVSCNGTLATGLRVILDGNQLALGTVTERTPTEPTLFRIGQPVGTHSINTITCFGYWQTQISAADDRFIHAEFNRRQNYKPQAIKYGVHTGHAQYVVASQQVLLNKQTHQVLHSRVDRANLDMSALQQSDNGALNADFLNRLVTWVKDCLAVGVEPLLCIVGAPTWLSLGTTTWHVAADMAAGSTFITKYRAYLQLVLPILKELGVKYYEIGNEPNMGSATVPDGDGAGFWRYPDTQKTLVNWAADYVTWATAISEEIRWVDPTARIAIGSLASYQALGTGYDGIDFYDAICDNAGSAYLHGLTDAVSLHPYAFAGDRRGPRVVRDFDNNMTDWRKLRNHMWRRGTASKKIWITETGWPIPTIDQTTDQASAVQVETTTWIQQELEDIQDYGSSFIELVTWFVGEDRPGSGFMGLMTGVNAGGGGWVDYTDAVIAGSTISEIRVTTNPSATAGRVTVDGQVVDYTGVATSPNRLTGCSGPGVRTIPRTGAPITNKMVIKTTGEKFRTHADLYSL